MVAKDYLLWQMKIRVSLQYLLRCRPEQSQVVVICVELESIDNVELDEDVEEGAVTMEVAVARGGVRCVAWSDGRGRGGSCVCNSSTPTMDTKLDRCETWVR